MTNGFYSANIMMLIIRILIISIFQVLVGIIFGYFTTFCNWGVSFLPDANSMPIRICIMLISTVIIAFGIFLYMPPEIMPLAGEGAMKAVSDVSGIRFSKVKIGFDVSMVVISLCCCLIFIRNLGSVGIGTVIAALLVGTVLEVITKKFGDKRDIWLGKKEESEVLQGTIPAKGFVKVKDMNKKKIAIVKF